MSRTFVDVGVVRIGEYITRAPKLAYIRGASSLIIDATADQKVLAHLHAKGFSGVTSNPDVGQSDGVVHLEVDSGPEAIASETLGFLRSELPGADLVASWAQGEDYTSAYPKMQAQRDAGRALEWYPAALEAPWLQPCSACNQAPAQAGDGDGRCADCQRRRETGRALDSLLEPTLRPSLAANHVALICADGNGVGALFDFLLEKNVPVDRRKEISAGLTKATTTAFREAAQAVEGRGPTDPVIPILQGGDDLSTFVAWRCAWPMLLQMLQHFEEETGHLLNDIEGAPPVSMSAGVVFMQYKYPAAQAYRIADGLMRRAKRATVGRQSSVSWLDITAHGVPAHTGAAIVRPALTRSVLQESDEQLRALAGLRKSLRSGLVSAMSEAASLGLPAEEQRTYLGKQADRLGVSDTVSPFLQADAAIPLAVALDLARSWQ